MPKNSRTAQAWAGLTPDQRDEALKQMSPEEVERLATEMGWEGHATGLRARPEAFSVAGLKERAYDLVKRGVSYLPTAGGVVGGLVGGALATPSDVATGPAGT